MSIRKFKEGLALESLTSAPSSPIKGQLYYDDTAASLYQYNGTSWVVVGSGSGGISAWVSAQSYSTGDIVYYTDNKIYRCTTANSDAVFTPAKWQALSVEGTGVLTAILKGDGSGGFSAAVSATDYAPATTGSSILKASSGGFANAISGTDYAPATSGTSILKGNGSGGFSNAISGTDYQAALGFTPENVANKSTTTTLGTSDTLYPTQNAVKTYVDSNLPPSTNYITNPGAESNTTGWDTYADAAASSPVDGTGGTASQLTLSRTTTAGEILVGSAAFKLAKSAANAQGQGVSTDFTVPRGFATTTHKISFNYQTTANFSYTNNDIVVYIYDVSASSLIQPVPYILDGSGKAVLEFQTNANTSTSYRLIFHVATTNANAYDFIFDNVVVYANQNQSQLLLQDREYDISSYIVNSANVTGVLRAVAVPYKTKNGIWRMRFNIQVTQSSNSYCVFTITGITLNSSFSATTGQAFATNPNAGYTGAGYAYSTNTFTLNVNGSSTATQQTASGDVELASMPTWAVDYYPVSSSDGAETRIVAALITGDPASASSGNPIIVPTISYDSHSAYNASTGRYTCPVSGIYKVYGALQSASSATTLHVYVDAVLTSLAGNLDSNGEATFNTAVKVNAGQIIDLRPGGTVDATSMTLNFERISGPATFSAQEFVGAKYQSNSGTSVPNTGSITTLDYNVKVYDTHNAVTTGASWKFTCPISGYYFVSAYIWYANTTWSTGNYSRIQLYKNGSADMVYFQNIIQNGFTNNYGYSGGVVVQLNAGDYIQIVADHNRSGGSASLYTSEPKYNTIDIFKITK